MPAAAQAKHVLYRGRFMVPFRLLVRFKVFQLVGVAALAVPINTFLVQASCCPLLHNAVNLLNGTGNQCLLAVV